MASNAKNNSLCAGLYSWPIVLTVWLPIAIITFLHYFTSHEYHFVHDILRRVYYLPIIIAALRLGMIGGIIAAAVVSTSYIPHAFLAMHHFDPARGLEKSLEMVLYFIVAIIAGRLSDLGRKRERELRDSLDEQKRLQNQLVRAGRLGALGEVVAGIAHEIKNPLHSMAGTAEIIEPLIPKESAERRMWEIHRQEIDRLKKVSNRFLSFASPQKMEMKKVELKKVAVRLEELLGAQARQRNIKLFVESKQIRVFVNGDIDQLVQIALNIGVNAIRAIGNKGGNIKVSTGINETQAGSQAFIKIENDGPSIKEEEFEHLFDPFHSGEKGTGLGLSISSRIAEQHGGFIKVDNAGLGVCFTVNLPLQKPNPV